MTTNERFVKAFRKAAESQIRKEFDLEILSRYKLDDWSKEIIYGWLFEERTSNISLRRENEELKNDVIVWRDTGTRLAEIRDELQSQCLQLCKELQEELATQEDVERENSYLKLANESLRKELEELKANLLDSAYVHSNILTGSIALTKAQAIHIVGLPADVEAQIESLKTAIQIMNEARIKR